MKRAPVLGQTGYRNVAVHAGGRQDWRQAGLPVERADPVAA